MAPGRALSAGWIPHSCARPGIGGLQLLVPARQCVYEKGRGPDGPERRAAAGHSKAGCAAPAEADLVIARAAVSEILTKGGKDASMPWENPKTGARGTITPLAPAYSEGGVTW